MADHSGLGSCSALTLAAGFRALSIARCDKRLLELHLLIVMVWNGPSNRHQKCLTWSRREAPQRKDRSMEKI
ncbi:MULTISPECIES: hypothetical protein, partial [unclassified Bradyrhizobium]|uniref:hypothetical protein n=1 Tax=unclassified Bradyrhizobium TaxID=2631580 RepID=UPI001FF9D15D